MANPSGASTRVTGAAAAAAAAARAGAAGGGGLDDAHAVDYLPLKVMPPGVASSAVLRAVLSRPPFKSARVATPAGRVSRPPAAAAAGSATSCRCG